VERGRALIEHERIPVVRIEPRFFADMAYDGQIHEVRTPLPDRPCGRDELQRAFEAAYTAQYGDTVGKRAVRVVTARVAVVGVRPPVTLSAPVNGHVTDLPGAQRGTRSVYFEGGFRETPVYERARLPRSATLPGPAIIEQGDTTTVLLPDMQARVDAYGNLILSVEST
jgi:N-methylhydantoinase A